VRHKESQKVAGDGEAGERVEMEKERGEGERDKGTRGYFVIGGRVALLK